MEEYTLQFGVELEICVSIHKDCVDRSKHSLSAAKQLRDLSFKEKMELLLNSGFIKTHLPGITHFVIQMDKKYAKSSQNPERYIVNVTGERGRSEMIKKVLPESPLHDRINNYEFPILMPDTSVICGDFILSHEMEANQERAEVKRLLSLFPSDHNNGKPAEEKKPIDPLGGFGFELVTPVFSLPLGEAIEKERIKQFLEPYFHLISLTNKNDCFFVNASTGFHVNASIVDKEGKSVNYDDPILAKSLYDMYADFETTRYSTEMRSRQPLKISTDKYIAFYAQPVSMLRNSEAMKKYKDYFVLYPNFKQYSFLNTKEGSLHRKERGKKKNIIEFRGYQAERNVNELYEHTADLLRLMRDSFFAAKEANSSAGSKESETLPLSSFVKEKVKFSTGGGIRGRHNGNRTKRTRKVPLHLRNTTRRAAKSLSSKRR